MTIRITVREGDCQGGVHEVGQVFTVERTTPAGMCLGAWNAIAPYVVALCCGGNFPWEEERGVATIHCPDPKGIMVELRRVDEGPE